MIRHRYLDVFPRWFSTSFEFAAFQFQVQIIPHITGHDHVGKAKLFRQTNILEEQRILLPDLGQFSV